jgi:RHS repeat-associated protein
LFTSKELDEESGMYYYSARYYAPPVFTSRDPLFEEKPWMSPYAYCSNNPINRMDPTGMFDDDIYYNEKGEEIYRVENNKLDRNFVIKTTQTTSDLYGAENRPGIGNSNPISAEDAATTEAEISKGNLKGDHMKNVVNLGTTKSIKKMMSIIKDDGNGGTSNNNNREYGGYKKDGVVIPLSPGPIVDPTKTKNPSISGEVIDFHSHPSGTKQAGNVVYGYLQPPSGTDIKIEKGTSMVFGMRSQTIYMYDKKGVKATIPMSIFK